MDRRLFLTLALVGLTPTIGAADTPTPADLLGATGEAYFITWLNDFYARTLAAGFARPLLDRELSGLSPDPRVAALDAQQPEFARPVSSYIAGVISNARIAAGRA